MSLSHRTADTADAARITSPALAECALVEGVYCILYTVAAAGPRPFRSDTAVEHQATLERIRTDWPNVPGIKASPDRWAQFRRAQFRLHCPGPCGGWDAVLGAILNYWISSHSNHPQKL